MNKMGYMKIVGAFAGVIIIIGLLNVLGFLGHEIAGTAVVVANALDPQTVQNEYVHFQQLKASIDNSGANIGTLIEAAKLKRPYGNRSVWDRTDKQQFESSIGDIVGNIALRNTLIKEYNADMSQWNTKIANFGSWPKGAKTREDFQNDFPGSYPEYSYGEEMKPLYQ